MEQIATAGDAAHHRQVRQARIYRREVQRASLDARDLRGPEEFSLCHFERGWRLQLAKSSGRQVHRERLARILWRANAGSNYFGQRNQDGELCIQGQAVLTSGTAVLSNVLPSLAEAG